MSEPTPDLGPDGPSAVDPADVDPAVATVLVVSKTHLDVGFTATAAQVRARYLEEYFPRAMSVAERLRERGGPERLRWTTGSWILTEALDAADRTDRARLEQAIEHGDLCWQALPFTLHTEYCDRSLLEHGMSLSAELDRRFGRRTRAAKVTDVPGHTRALVSVLAEAGDFDLTAHDIGALPEIRHALAGRESNGFWPQADGVVQVVTVPIWIDLDRPEIMGTLTVGFRLDNDLAAQFDLAYHTKHVDTIFRRVFG